MRSSAAKKTDTAVSPLLTLSQISAQIKVLEKKSLKNLIEIGRLLRMAEEQCNHGQYMEWIKTEFAWLSHDTSLNYRYLYDLSRNPNCSDFEHGTCRFVRSIASPNI